MDKYKVTEKQLKTRSATYYRAINNDTGQKVLIKKLNKGRSWEDLLCDKFINLLKLEKFTWAPKVIQIIKDQERHYIIFQNLQNSLSDLLAKDKSFNTVLGVAKRINEVLKSLKQQGINPKAIKAEYFFVDKEDIKLTHIPEGEQIDLINASPQRANQQPITDKSNMFQLACLMVQSLTGKPLIQAMNKKQYQIELAKLFPQKWEQSKESIRSILKNITSDYQFIQLVQSMLNSDPNKRPGIQSVGVSFKRFSTNSPHKSSNKLLFFSSLQKIDSNKINILRKCNQISTRFLEDNYSQLAQIPRIVSQTSPLPPQQHAADNTVISKIKPQTNSNMIIQHPIVSPKNRQKGTETLPRLYNRKQQHTNYVRYKHQHLGVESDYGVDGYGEEKFTQI